MSDAPRLSFIVLSYNYADLIGQTIRSILDQTVQDFEVVVVDDASADNSCDVIRSFGDPRIRLLVNERNLGGAGSYNRAVQAARGEYLVNVDADDWIVPEKCEMQLAFLQQHKVAVVGSYATFVDREGRPVAQGAAPEAEVNQPFDLNAVETWIGHNRLVRSSTMVERIAHLSVGLDDASMVRAPDYELWTRFLRAGHRLTVLPEKLLFYRVHPGGVTHGDPRGTFLEMSYATMRNLVPLIEQRAVWPSLARIIGQWVQDDAFIRLRPIERYRLLGMLLSDLPPGDFALFRETLEADPQTNPATAATGRRLLAHTTQAVSVEKHGALLDEHWRLGKAYQKLSDDSAAYVEARDFWHDEHWRLSKAYQKLSDDSAAYVEARDFWHNEHWRLSKANQKLSDDSAAYVEARDFWHKTSESWEAEAKAKPAPPPPSLLTRVAHRFMPRRRPARRMPADSEG